MILNESPNKSQVNLEELDAIIRVCALEDLLLDFEGWKYHGEFKEFDTETHTDEEFVRYQLEVAEDYLGRLQDDLYGEESE